MSEPIITNELKQLLDTKKDVTEQTKKNYLNQYKKLYNELNDTLSNSSENKIMEVIKTISNDNPSNMRTYLNVPIMIKKLLEQPVGNLEKWRDELKGESDTHTKKNNDEKDLPSLKELEEFTENLFKEGKYRAYIINKLLLTFGLRNKDLDLLIVNKEPDDVSKNYLVTLKDGIELIINDFKTAKNYGTNNLVLKSKKVLEAVDQLDLELSNKLLEGSTVINKYISRRLYKHNGKYLGEADYFKVLLKATMRKKNSMDELKRLSDTRGSDVNTLIKYYNIQGSKSK